MHIPRTRWSEISKHPFSRLMMTLVCLGSSGLALAPESASANEHPSVPALAPLLAKDWRIVQGRWTFQETGDLICEGSSLSSLIYRRAFKARDLDLTVEVMFLGPQSSAGIFFRASGKQFYRDTTFYQFEWYTAGTHHGQRLSLMIKNPRWKQIVTPQFPLAPYNKWISMRVRAQDDHLECFVNGERVFEKRDRVYLRSGEAGLHVFQPRKVKFRNFTLKEF